MRDSLLFLEDIIESLSKINRYIEGLEYSDFAKDEYLPLSHKFLPLEI